MKPFSGKKLLFSLLFALLLIGFASPGIKNIFAKNWTLEQFQSQTLKWKSCGGSFECSTLTVPIDYNKLGKSVFHLQVLRHSATNPSKRLGAIVVNPGGPGGSGVDYAANAELVVSSAIYSRYDIVGFDPRGVNSSEPIRCQTDTQTDTFLANDGKADTPKQTQALISLSREFARLCAHVAGHNLGHYSTLEGAKDMELLRSALHETKLNYLGKSYGTYLGTLYAALYPNSMGRFVLDGAVDPNVSIRDQNLAQAVAFDLALHDFLTQQGKIKLAEIEKLIASAEIKPLASTSNRKVTPALIVTGIAASLYDNQNGWPQLAAALGQAITQHNGQLLLDLSDEYTHRDKSGQYLDNQNDISQIISCMDWRDPRSLAQIQPDVALFAKAAPVFGPFLAYAGLPCHYWAVPPLTLATPIRNLATPPLLVIGVTRDPATPYQWAQALHQDLKNSTLLTFNGDGHTGHNRGSSCIDSVVDSFFLTGKVPGQPLVCRQ